MCAGLFELPDDLQSVACDVLFVEQIDVLDAAVIEDEVADVVIVDFACLVDAVVAGFVQILLDEPLPFAVLKYYIIQRFQLLPDIGEHLFGGVEFGEVLVALIFQVVDELTLERILALIGFVDHSDLGVSVQYDEVPRFDDGFAVLKHLPLPPTEICILYSKIQQVHLIFLYHSLVPQQFLHLHVLSD